MLGSHLIRSCENRTMKKDDDDDEEEEEETAAYFRRAISTPCEEVWEGVSPSLLLLFMVTDEAMCGDCVDGWGGKGSVKGRIYYVYACACLTLDKRDDDDGWEWIDARASFNDVRTPEDPHFFQFFRRCTYV